MDSIICYDFDGFPLNYFYQWDANRILRFSGIDTTIATEVHFSHIDSTEALVSVPQADGAFMIVSVPNILLQKAKPLVIYVYQNSDSLGLRTVYSICIPINPRAKPTGYVYTETEVLGYRKIDERLRLLEEKSNNGTGLSVSSDGNGNVILSSSCATSIASDGNGNIIIAKEGKSE